MPKGVAGGGDCVREKTISGVEILLILEVCKPLRCCVRIRQPHSYHCRALLTSPDNCGAGLKAPAKRARARPAGAGPLVIACCSGGASGMVLV